MPELVEVAGVGVGTGNLKVPGNLHVAGDIRAGFRVSAGGNLEVDGIVESSFVEAGGEIHVHGGFAGGGKGKIAAGGDVHVKFAQQAVIETPANVFIGETAMYCTIRAGKKVVVSGSGVLLGGCVRAGERIEAVQIGSPAVVPTEVEVGIDPRVGEKLRDSRERLESLETRHRLEMENIQFALSRLGVQFPDPKAHNLSKMMYLVESLQGQNDEKAQVALMFLDVLPLMEQMAVIRHQLRSVGESPTYFPGAAIVASRCAYPGVTLKIGDQSMVLSQEYEQVRFTVRDNTIRVESQ
ncbi:MAG TPA: FapA family protein [bacterium]|nr:FapA family protein [bacterium]